jgi:hypothetical protein
MVLKHQSEFENRVLKMRKQVRSVVESNRPDTRNALYQQTIKQVRLDLILLDFNAPLDSRPPAHSLASFQRRK